MRLITRGTWPGPVILRRGWARAEARKWNDEYDEAHLRLIRGGPAFIHISTEELLTVGAPGVISPPLPSSAQRAWISSGFEHHTDLGLLRLDLTQTPRAPSHLVMKGSRADLVEAIRIDSAAFDPFWRLDEAGLTEAMGATPTAEIVVIRDGDEGLCGFAVVGYGSALAYLQRLAVDVPWQGQGMGRSLVRVAARNARSRGATALLLNTQTDNQAALCQRCHNRQARNRPGSSEADASGACRRSDRHRAA